MLHELNDILASGDPETMSRRLDEVDAKLTRAARSYEDLEQSMRSMRITESDPGGAITVTVDGRGQLIAVETNQRLAQLGADQVGPAVLACVRRAQAKIAGEIVAAARQTVGEDGMADHIVETMREWYPEQPDDPADASEASTRAPRQEFLDIGEIEDDDQWRNGRA